MISEIISSLDRLLSELQEQFDKIRPHFVSAQEMTATLSQQMNQMVENFEILDQDMVSQLGM